MKRISLTAQERLSRNNVQVPPIPRLDHWFKSDVQKALAALIEQINLEQQLAIQQALKVALSSIIVRVSNQESDTRNASLSKTVSAQDVFNQFERAVATVSRAIYSVTDNLFRSLGRATIINRDILAVTSNDLPAGVGLVVTSPPYPNAYGYWLYHKYRMYWLGMTLITG